MRKSVRALLVAVTLVVAPGALGATPALATSTHIFSHTIGEPGSGDGQLELSASSERGASGVAVNDTTHDVYVADTGNHRVDEFSSSGAFIRAWGWGVADGTTEAFQVCTSGCHAGLPGTGGGQLNEPTWIAVDNSGGPSQGDVYVADRTGSIFSGGSAYVIKFTASGGYVSTNNGIAATAPISGPFGSTIGGIATDTSGNLWVYAETGSGASMLEFAQDGTFVTDWSTHFAQSVVHVGMVSDPAGNLDFYGRGGLDRHLSSGALVGTIKPFGINGLAVDSNSDDLYVDQEGEQIVHYDRSCDPAKGICTPVDSFGSGGELSGAWALAVDASNDAVYAANIGSDQIAVFGRTPDATTGRPTNRTPTTAVLSGTVNPDNTAVSDCHFDYVADAEYQAGEPDPYAAGSTVPCDTTPSGSRTVAVHAEATGLTPGVAYHFRLEATNVYGTGFGTDETVPGTPPAIESTSAAEVTSAAADLRADINPDGGDTTYRFEYGIDASYGSSIPVPDADIGSGVTDVSVSRRVQGLRAGTSYHYRVIAHNPLGTTAGPDHTLATQLNSGGSGVDTCPNAAVRAQQSAADLPDCRAYEQVSPPEKDGSGVLVSGEHGGVGWASSPDGDAVTYTSAGVFADAQTGGAVVSSYLASRAQGGWSTHSLLPLQEPGTYLPFPTFFFYSTDLSKAVLLNGGGNATRGQDQPPVVPGEPAQNENLFLRDNSTNSYQLMDVTPPGVTPASAKSEAGSPDLSHVFFAENAQLTADSPPAGENAHLYEWDAGVVRLVGIMPDGTPVPASLEAEVPHASEFSSLGGVMLEDHAVSNDGSRVFFQVRTGGVDRGLYLRQNATNTVQVDASRGPGPGGGGNFVVASGDGSEAFFVDDAANGLTSDTVPGSGINLYRYDVGSRTLSDLTPAPKAEVLGVLGASEDSSYLYFAANGVLAPGASPGNCANGSTGDPSHTCNLYLYHNGSTTFIATLNGEDLGDWQGSIFNGTNYTATVSPDGRYLAFQSLNSLTGYDNLAANGLQCGNATRTGGGTSQPRCTEIYLYDAAAGSQGKLGCASCDPSGGAPIGPSALTIPDGQDGIFSHMPRHLSDGGRLFFNSLDALAPQDSNGQWDVYEYEAGGDGSCGETGGCVSLISSGTSPGASLFRDASVTGEDVFFTTTDRLVAQDGDQSSDLYDAKVDGGLESQNIVPPPSCGGEACKPPASGQPAEQTPGSSGFSGMGNLKPVPAVAVRSRPLTSAQKLAAALKLCRSVSRNKRGACIRKAKKRYGSSAINKRTKRAKRARDNRRVGK